MTPMRLSGFVEDAAANLTPRLFTSLNLRTAISPDSEITNAKEVADLLQGKELPPSPPGTGSRLLYALKPTFTVRSPTFGTKVYAPYGVAVVGEDRKNLAKLKAALALITVGLVATGFVLGRSTK